MNMVLTAEEEARLLEIRMRLADRPTMVSVGYAVELNRFVDKLKAALAEFDWRLTNTAHELGEEVRAHEASAKALAAAQAELAELRELDSFASAYVINGRQIYNQFGQWFVRVIGSGKLAGSKIETKAEAIALARKESGK